MASQDLKQKDKLYEGFMNSLKWIIPLLCLIVAIIIALIS